jgi:phosphatidate cytidylyltransferase
MVQYKMILNLKHRIITSTILLFLFILMLINNYILIYSLIVLGMFAILEFFKINQIILKKKRFKQLFTNIIFIIYIFSFCSFFIIFSFFFHIKIILFIILLTCIASDIGGFIFGKIFKGPKLTKISPNKTVSGAIGSITFSLIILSTSIFYLTKTFDLNILIVGIVTSLGCQFGDLFFSFLKRKSSLKDTGNLLPGHGGILDRIDGLLLGVPLGYIILLLIF